MSRMHNPAHPGEVLREYLPEKMAVAEAAKRLGVTRQTLSALLNGRAGVSAEMALRLEEALGTSAEMWLEMQAGYDFGRHGNTLVRKSTELRRSSRLESRARDVRTPFLHEVLPALRHFIGGGHVRIARATARITLAPSQLRRHA